MKINTPKSVSRSSALSLKLLAALASLAPLSYGAEIFKANNPDALAALSSWIGGVVPGPADIAVWDSTVAENTFAIMDASISLGGLKVVGNTAGLFVDSFASGGAGVVMTLGTSGVDFSGATSGTTFTFDTPTVTVARAQPWSVADGATVVLKGPLTRAFGATINFNLGATSTGIFRGDGWTGASTILAYATVNGTDLAALDASKNVITGVSRGTYVPNVNSGAADPNMIGTFGTIDVVNSNTGAVNAFRLGNSTGVTPAGIRFNTAHATGMNWVVDVPSGRNLNVSNQGIIVTSAVGAKDVFFNGAGNIRLSAGSQLHFHQYNPAGNLTLNAQINQPAGAGASVVKAGPGRMILASNGNGYLGGTAIAEGTLQIGNGGTTGVLGSGNVTNHGVLVFNRTNSYTPTQNISGTGQVTQAGTGETIFTTNVNTYSGATNLNAGTLTFSSLGSLGSGTALNFNGGALNWATGNTDDISGRTVTLNSPGGILNTNGGNITLANPIGNGGAGGLTKTGLGALTLGAANSYSGNTTLSAGSLILTNASGSATGSGNITTAIGTTLGGGGSASGTASVALGAILAPGSNGVGTLTLGGLNLAAGSIVHIEFASPSSFDKVVSTNLTLNGGGLQLYNAGGTTQFATAGTYGVFEHTNATQGTGAGSLSVLNPKAGFSYSFADSGTVVSLVVAQDSILSNWSPFVGGSWGDGANWSNGVPTTNYTAQFVAPLAAPATLTLDGNRTVNGAVFDSANGYTVAQGTSGTLTFDKGVQSAAINVLAGNHTISAPVLLTSTIAVTTNANTSLSFTGNATGPGGVTKAGAGILDLTGVNSFAGNINAVAGVLGFSQADSLGAGALTLNGATLRYNTGNTADISTRSITVGQDGAGIDTNGNDVTLASAFGNSGSGFLTKAGAGTLTLGGNNTFSGGTRVTGGVLRITSDANLGTSGSTLTLDGGAISAGTLSLDSSAIQRPISMGAGGGTVAVDAAATLTVGGTISGGGPWTKTGNGTLLLTGVSSSNPSPITISAGTVQLGGGTANLNNALGSGTVTFMGGTLVSNNALIDPSGASTFTGIGNNLVVPTGQTGTVVYSGRGDSNGSLTGNGTLNVTVGASRAAFGGNWSAYTGQINIGGTGEFRLNGASIFNGASVHLGAGVLVQQIFNPPSGGETIQNIGALSGDAGARLGGNPVGGRWVNWTIGSKNLDTTFAGIILNDTDPAVGFGEARITKVGTGNLTLSGNSTYTGSTTVNDGTLIITGNLGNTPTTVNAPGILVGTGSIGGNLNINGTLRPDPTGTSGGQLTLGGLVTFSSNATTQIDIAAAVAPKINSTLTDAVTYGGVLKFRFPSTVYNGSYPVIQRVGTVAGAFTGVTVTTATTTDAPLTDNTGTTGTWDGTVDSATYSFNPSTGSLLVSGATVAAAPAVPTGLVATPGNNQVSLSWNPSANADVYIIKRATVSGGPYTALISTQPIPSLVDATAVNGTEYFYVVAAKNNNGLVSADSAQVSATPSDAPVLNGLQTWRAAQFGVDATNPAIAGDNADPDGDGMVNFLEYATNHLPLTPDGPATTVGNNGTRLTLTYKSVADPLLTYTVQGVNDISGTPAWGNGTIQTTTGVANTSGTQTVTDSQLLSASPRRFLRLNVTYPASP